MQFLTHCTLTGVDSRSDLALVSELSMKHPMVEWGFLYSPKRQGQPGRYPSVDFLRNAFKKLPAHVRVALHICGSGVPELLEDESVVSGLAKLVEQRSGRVQLNFSAHSFSRPDRTLDQIHQCLEKNSTIEFITQYNQSNIYVWKILQECKNHSILFDASGGRGIEATRWEKPLPGVRCGYAGGLGPDNVASELVKIQANAGANHFWIDMEGKLRDKEDWFSMSAAKAVLGALAEYKSH